MEQLNLYHDELVSQNQRLVRKVDDACWCIPKLAIAVDLPPDVCIHSLETGVREAKEETKKVQLELNLQIVKLRLKAQPSTPLEIREQCASTIKIGMEEIGAALHNYTDVLEQALEILITLQEDTNI